MKVKHCMTAHPIVAAPDTTVAEIARLLSAHQIGCVPVVDGRGVLAGLVTESDLFPREQAVPFSTIKAPSLAGEWVDPNRLEESYRSLGSAKAAEVMSRRLMTVDENAPLGEAARLMMKYGRRHLPVTGPGGELVGVLTRRDVLRAFCKKASARPGERAENLARAV